MKNLNLGKFMQDSSGNLHGKISGLGIGSTNVISEQATSSSGKDYLKLIADPLGDAYEIGVAFPREKEGLHYYSVILDCLFFPHPIDAALFPDQDKENILNLVWNRVDESHQPRRYVGASANAATL